MEEMMKQVERRDKQVEEQSESVSIDHLEDNSIMVLTFLHWNGAAIRRSKRTEAQRKGREKACENAGKKREQRGPCK